MKDVGMPGNRMEAGDRIRNLDLTEAFGGMAAEVLCETRKEDESCGTSEQDFWKAHYMQLMEKVRNGSYPMTTDYQTVLQYEQGTEQFVDGIIVSAIDAKEGSSRLGVSFSYSFAEDVSELYWMLSFPELGASAYGGMAPAYQKTEEVYLDLEKEVSAAEGVLQVTWRCREGDVVKSQAQKVFVNPQGDMQFDWKVKDPVRSKDSQNPYILVIYGRIASGAECPDYSKKEQISENNDSQELLLDCNGEIVCAEKIRYAYSNLVLIAGCGMASSNTMELKISDNKLEFHQPEDWGAKVPTKRLSMSDTAYLSLTIGIEFENGQRAELRLNSADEGWADQDEADHAYTGSGRELKIHPLKMLWGCVAEDTMVTMADGSRRRICELMYGERILSGDGSAAEISTVYSGEKKELYVLVLEDGSRLRATDTHPVKTDAGYIPLKHLAAGDWVQMQDGSMQQAAALYTEAYSGKVYNLQLSGGKSGMYCNGILAGDFITENLSRTNHIERSAEQSA